MILGIWFFGPLAMAIGIQPHGGAFLDIVNLPNFFILWLLFPISTMTMSVYSNSFGGLILTTTVFTFVELYFWIRAAYKSIWKITKLPSIYIWAGTVGRFRSSHCVSGRVQKPTGSAGQGNPEKIAGSQPGGGEEDDDGQVEPTPTQMP